MGYNLRTLIRWYFLSGGLISSFLVGNLFLEVLFLPEREFLGFPEGQFLVYPLLLLIVSLLILISWPAWILGIWMILMSNTIPSGIDESFWNPSSTWFPIGILIILLISIIPFLSYMIVQKLTKYEIKDIMKKVKQPSLLIGALVSSLGGSILFIFTDYVSFPRSEDTQLDPIWENMTHGSVGFLRVLFGGELVLIPLFLVGAGAFLTIVVISLYALRTLSISPGVLSRKVITVGLILSALICLFNLWGYYNISPFVFTYPQTAVILIGGDIWPDTALIGSVWLSGLSVIFYFLLLYEPRKDMIQSFPSYFKRNSDSPFFIGLYIIISLVVLSGILATGNVKTTLYFRFGGLITLIMALLFFFTVVRSFRNYFMTNIREFGVFGLVILTLLLFGVMNIGFIAYGVYLAEQVGRGGGTDWGMFLIPDSIFAFLLGGGALATFGAVVYIVVIPEGGSLNLFEQFLYILFNLNNGVALFVHFIFSLYFMRGLWITIPRKVRILASFIGGYILFRTFLSITNLSSLSDFPLVEALLWSLLDLILHSYLFFFTYLYIGVKIYKYIDPPNPTSRVITATKLWRIVLILFSVYSVIIGIWYEFGFIISLLLNVIEDFLYDIFGVLVYDVFGLWYHVHSQFPIFLVLLLITALSLLAYIGLRYPEGLLIFETHLFRAKEAYEKIKEQQTKTTEVLTLSGIEEYLSQIPPEFFEQATIGKHLKTDLRS